MSVDEIKAVLRRAKISSSDPDGIRYDLKLSYDGSEVICNSSIESATINEK